LRQLAQHNQFRQRRRRADLPGGGAVADRFHQLRCEEERQAFVAADMLVGAGVFIAGMADQHRSRHQLAELAAAMQAKTALAHIGNRVMAMLLRERLVAGPRGAAKVGNGNGFALEKPGRRHPADLGMRAGRRNRQQHVERCLLAVGLTCATERRKGHNAGLRGRIWNLAGVNSETRKRTEQLGGRREVG
jgi:hypothetical protein